MSLHPDTRYYDKEYFIIAPLFGVLGATAAIVFTGRFLSYNAVSLEEVVIYFKKIVFQLWAQLMVQPNV